MENLSLKGAFLLRNGNLLRNETQTVFKVNVEILKLAASFEKRNQLKAFRRAQEIFEKDLGTLRALVVKKMVSLKTAGLSKDVGRFVEEKRGGAKKQIM